MIQAHSSGRQRSKNEKRGMKAEWHLCCWDCSWFLLLQDLTIIQMTHARSQTHTQKHNAWLSRREKLETQLLYRGCLAFDGCGSTSKLRQRGENLKGKHLMGLRGPGCLALVGKQPRDITCHILRILKPRALAMVSGRDPHLGRGAQAVPLACPAADSARKDPRPDEKSLYSWSANTYTNEL